MQKSTEERFILSQIGRDVIDSGLFSKAECYKKAKEILLYIYKTNRPLTLKDIEKGLEYKFNPHQINGVIRAGIRRKEIEST